MSQSCGSFSNQDSDTDYGFEELLEQDTEEDMELEDEIVKLIHEYVQFQCIREQDIFSRVPDDMVAAGTEHRKRFEFAELVRIIITAGDQKQATQLAKAARKLEKKLSQLSIFRHAKICHNALSTDMQRVLTELKLRACLSFVDHDDESELDTSGFQKWMDVFFPANDNAESLQSLVASRSTNAADLRAIAALGKQRKIQADLESVLRNCDSSRVDRVAVDSLNDAYPWPQTRKLIPSFMRQVQKREFGKPMLCRLVDKECREKRGKKKKARKAQNTLSDGDSVGNAVIASANDSNNSAVVSSATSTNFHEDLKAVDKSSSHLGKSNNSLQDNGSTSFIVSRSPASRENNGKSPLPTPEQLSQSEAFPTKAKATHVIYDRSQQEVRASPRTRYSKNEVRLTPTHAQQGELRLSPSRRLRSDHETRVSSARSCQNEVRLTPSRQQNSEVSQLTSKIGQSGYTQIGNIKRKL